DCAEANHFHHYVQWAVPWAVASVQGRSASHGGRVQRHRYAGAAALAWSEDPDRRGRSRGGRNAVYSCAWQAAYCVHTKTGWLAVLSHSQPRRRKSRGWTVQRTSGAGVHRAETGTGQIRPRSLSCPKGIRAHVQSRRRHGHGVPVSADWRQVARASRGVRNESIDREGHATRVRGQLRIVHDQRTHARSWGADSCEAGGTRPVSYLKRK